MRIAYTCHDAFPSSSTNTQQTFWTLLELARLGASIDLIVPAVVDAGRDPLPGIARYYGARPEDVPHSLRVTATGTRPPAGWIDQGRFDWRAPAACGSCDLAWTRDPLALVALIRRGVPTIFETYRPDFAERRRFAPWRRACLSSPHLRGVVTHSRLAANAFVAGGVDASRVLVAHNGFAPSLMQPALTKPAARAQLSLSGDRPLAIYAGHVGPSKGVDVLVALAAAVPEASIVIVGASRDSGDGRRLIDAAAQAGVRNLLLRPRVPLAEVAPYLYAADCLLIPPTDEPLRRFRRTVLPMKVFMYLAAGRPILAPRLPDIEEVLTDGETARLVPPGDPREAGRMLTALLSDSALQERLSSRALAASVGYTWEARARRILSFLS